MILDYKADFINCAPIVASLWHYSNLLLGILYGVDVVSELLSAHGRYNVIILLFYLYS